MVNGERTSLPNGVHNIDFVDQRSRHDLSRVMYHRGAFKLFTTQSGGLSTLTEKPLENIVGKGENAGNQHFLLFPQCFLFFQRLIP